MNEGFLVRTYKKYISSEFLKNSSILIITTFLAQLITLGFSPLLGRLYSPEQVGVYSLCFSVVTIVGAVATLRYELSIVLPKDNEDAKVLFLSSLLIAIVITLLYLIIGSGVFLLNKDGFFAKMDYVSILLIAMGILLMGINQSMNYLCIRLKKFKLNGLARLLVSFTTALIIVFLGYFWGGQYQFLLIAFIISQFLGAVLYWICLPKEFFSEVNIFNKYESIKTLLKKHRSFAFINTPHVLFDGVQENSVIFLFGYFFSAKVVGWYSFAYRLLKAPVGLVGNAFYNVFYQRMAEKHSKGISIMSDVKRMYKTLLMFGLPCFLLAFFMIPFIFEFLFGSKWIEAGIIAQIMVPWLFLNFMASPVSSIVVILNKQKGAFLFTIVDFFFKVVAILIGKYFNSYKLALYIMTFGSSLVMVAGLIWYYRLAKSTQLSTI